MDVLELADKIINGKDFAEEIIQTSLHPVILKIMYGGR